MREMVLNHASLCAPDQETAVDWLQGMAVGISVLVRDHVVSGYLRMQRPVYETLCVTDWTLFDAYQEVRRRGAREEYLLLVKLSTKVPLLSEVEQDIVERFGSCQEKTLSTDDGKPLVLCAITDGVAVGFPSEPVWDSDQLTVTFDELLSDGDIEEAHEIIDNLARDIHAKPICERHRTSIQHSIRNPGELWEKRGSAFPNLSFGPDVEKHLRVLDSAVSQIVVKRLKGLDESAREWRDAKSSEPQWKSKVTLESDAVVNNAKLREARRFRSHHGCLELYMLHARFGSFGRIHFRIYADRYEIEIGYIGNKLPTAKFPT